MSPDSVASQLDSESSFDPLSDTEPPPSRRVLQRHDYIIRTGIATTAGGFLVAFVAALGLGAGPMRWEEFFSSVHQFSLYMLLGGLAILAYGYRDRRLRRNVKQLGWADQPESAPRAPRAATLDIRKSVGVCRRWLGGFWPTFFLIAFVTFCLNFYLPIKWLGVSPAAPTRASVPFNDAAIWWLPVLGLMLLVFSLWQGNRWLRAFSAGMATVQLLILLDVILIAAIFPTTDPRILDYMPGFVLVLIWLSTTGTGAIALFFVWVSLIGGYSGIVGKLAAEFRAGRRTTAWLQGILPTFLLILSATAAPRFGVAVIVESFGNWSRFATILGTNALNAPDISWTTIFAAGLIVLSLLLTLFALRGGPTLGAFFGAMAFPSLPVLLVGTFAASHLVASWDATSWHPLSGLAALMNRLPVDGIAVSAVYVYFVAWFMLLCGYSGVAGAWMGRVRLGRPRRDALSIDGITADSDGESVIESPTADGVTS